MRLALARFIRRLIRLPGVPSARFVAEKAVAPYLRADLAELAERITALEIQRNDLVHRLDDAQDAATTTSRTLAGSLRHVQRQIVSGANHLVRLDELSRTAEDLRSQGTEFDARLAELEGDRFDAVLARIDSVEGRAETTMQRVEMTRAETLFELRYGSKGPGILGERVAADADADADADARIVNVEKVDARRDDLHLNVGCGHITPEEFINVDARALPGVDVVASAGSLPFDPDTVHEIFSSHLLEHFPLEQLTRQLFPHWVELLVDGGRLRAVVPDMPAMARALVGTDMSFDDFRRVAYGEQEYDGDFHFNGFSPQSLRALLEAAGLSDVNVVAEGRRNGLCFEFEIEAVKRAAVS